MPNFIGCSEEQQTRLTDAYENLIGSAVLTTHFADLRDLIIGRWATINIKCGAGTDECDGLDGAWNGTRLLMCDFSARRIGPILLHELVHVCNGSELDSEAIENACFEVGATLPTSGDFPKFCRDDVFPGDSNSRVARFVIWNSVTGEVWVRARGDDGTVVRGALLFQSNRWIRRCS